MISLKKIIKIILKYERFTFNYLYNIRNKIREKLINSKLLRYPLSAERRTYKFLRKYREKIINYLINSVYKHHTDEHV